MPENSATSSQTAMKQIAQMLNFVRQYGMDPNANININNDGSIKLNYDPAKNPMNRNSSQNAGQQVGTAMQAASKAATPPNLQGIIDPKVLQMLAGNQQNLQNQALQIPQAVGALGYQNAMTDQLNRGPQDLIMGLAGKFYDTMLQGQQAKELKQETSGDTVTKLAMEKLYPKKDPVPAGVQELNHLIKLKIQGLTDPAEIAKATTEAINLKYNTMMTEGRPERDMMMALLSNMFASETIADMIASADTLPELFALVKGKLATGKNSEMIDGMEVPKGDKFVRKSMPKEGSEKRKRYVVKNGVLVEK